MSRQMLKSLLLLLIFTTSSSLYLIAQTTDIVSQLYEADFHGALQSVDEEMKEMPLSVENAEWWAFKIYADYHLQFTDLAKRELEELDQLDVKISNILSPDAYYAQHWIREVLLHEGGDAKGADSIHKLLVDIETPLKSEINFYLQGLLLKDDLNGTTIYNQCLDTIKPGRYDPRDRCMVTKHLVEEEENSEKKLQLLKTFGLDLDSMKLSYSQSIFWRNFLMYNYIDFDDKGSVDSLFEINLNAYNLEGNDNLIIHESYNLKNYSDFQHGSTSDKWTQKAISCLEKNGYTNTMVMGSYLSSLGALYSNNGKYSLATKTLSEAKSILEGLQLTSSVHYLGTLNNLAIVLKHQGDLSKAAEIYEQALLGLEQLLGAEHHYCKSVTINLCRVYNELGDYQVSINMLESIIDKERDIKKGLNMMHESAYLALSESYLYSHQYEEAYTILNYVLEAQKFKEYTDTLFIRSVENNLAEAMDGMGNPREAIDILKRSLNRSTGKIRLREVATKYSNLSQSYYKIGVYDSTYHYAKLALSIQDTLLDEHSYQTSITYLDLVDVCMKLNKPIEFETYLSRYLELKKSEIESYYPIMNERKVLAFFESKYQEMDKVLGRGLSEWCSPENRKGIYELHLNTSNLSLRYNKTELYGLKATESTEVSDLFYMWKNVNEQIAKAEESSVLDSLQRKGEELELKMNRFLNLKLDNSWYSLEAVQHRLSDREMILDLVDWKDSIIVNYILRDSFSVLDHLTFKENPDLSHMSDIINQRNINKVYIISSGSLFNRYDYHELLGGIDELFTCFSPADLFERNMDLAGKDWLIVGGISYGLGDEQQMAAHVRGDDQLPFTLAALPYSKTEVEQIISGAQTLTGKSNIQQLMGHDFSKESFLSELTGKEVELIHIAGHGYFNIPEDFNYRESKISSGLFLSGYNDLDDESKFEGLLMPKDLETISEPGLKLVVLSACNSGQGMTNQRDGIFGMMRSFKKMGAKNVIVNASSVADEVSLRFFEKFYEMLFKGQTIKQAFDQTKSEMEGFIPEGALKAFVLYGLGEDRLIEGQGTPTIWVALFCICVLGLLVYYLILSKKTM